MRELKL